MTVYQNTKIKAKMNQDTLSTNADEWTFVSYMDFDQLILNIHNHIQIYIQQYRRQPNQKNFSLIVSKELLKSMKDNYSVYMGYFYVYDGASLMMKYQLKTNLPKLKTFFVMIMNQQFHRTFTKAVLDDVVAELRIDGLDFRVMQFVNDGYYKGDHQSIDDNDYASFVVFMQQQGRPLRSIMPRERFNLQLSIALNK